MKQHSPSRRKARSQWANSATRRPSLHRQAHRAGWRFALPAIIYVIGFGAIPLVATLVLSTYRWNLAQVRIPPMFVGVENYVELFLQDPLIRQAIRNTLVFIVGTVALQTVLGVSIAVLLNQQLKGTRVAMALILIPMTIAPAVVAWLFSVLFSETLGPINYSLTSMGLPAPPWLSSSRWALPSIILVDVWQWTPFIVLITLAGLRAQSPTVHEAATVDGASNIQRFVFITLPLLRPVLAIAVLLRVIDAFKMFDLVYLLTFGGPGTSSQVLSFYAFRIGISFFDMGRGSAISTVMLFVAMAFAVLFYRVTRRAH